MIYKYEMACKEAGLSDEATAEIRRFFDAEKKKLKRDKAYREAKGITFSYLYPSEEDSEETGDLACRELIDENADVEETTMQKLLLEQLHDALDELSDDDREFLLFMFSGYCHQAYRYGTARDDALGANQRANLKCERRS